MIKAVSFDGDDTLWSFDDMMRQALASTLTLLEEMTGEKSIFTVGEVIMLRNGVEAERGPLNPRNTVEDIRRESFRRIAVLSGLEGQISGDKLTEHYFEVKTRVGTLFPEVEPVIQQLRAAYRVGEITNGNHSPAVFGSDVKLDFVVMAQDIGIVKPDAEIFEHAARLAGCDVTEMMHVGDSLESDVAGANGVGAVSIWFNPASLENDLGVRPDYEIRSLSEIPEILDAHQDDR